MSSVVFVHVFREKSFIRTCAASHTIAPIEHAHIIYAALRDPYCATKHKSTGLLADKRSHLREVCYYIENFFSVFSAERANSNYKQYTSKCVTIRPALYRAHNRYQSTLHARRTEKSYISDSYVRNSSAGAPTVSCWL